MYNLASMLESIIEKLDFKKCDELAAMKQVASDMQSFYSSDVWNKTKKTESERRGRMDSIPEEEDARGSRYEDEDEDDLGVFDNDIVRGALNLMDYQVAYVAFGVMCAFTSHSLLQLNDLIYSFHILLRL